MGKSDWVRAMSPEVRYSTAKDIINKLVDQTLVCLELHAANRVLVFDSSISALVPKWDAWSAFSRVRDSQYRYEVLRWCAMWDSASKDRMTIPSVWELIEEPSVKELARQDFLSLWPDEQDWAEKQYQATKTRLNRVEALTKNTIEDCRYRTVRGIRDEHIAHSLRDGTTKHAKNYNIGTEAWLGRRSALIVAHLHQAICLSSFDWKDAMKQFRRNANVLRTSIRFDR